MWSYVIRNATIDSKMTIDGGVFTGTQGAVSAAIGSLTVMMDILRLQTVTETMEQFSMRSMPLVKLER